MSGRQDFELQCSHGRLSVDGNCRGVAEAEVEEGVMHLISKVESNGFGVWVIPPSNVAATDSRNEREHGGNGENGPGNVGVTKQESGKREKSVNAGRALFPLASYFNHSCEPTCECFQQGTTMTIKTIRSVKEGEELTISYMDTNLPVQARRSQLSQDYYFLCRCVRCERELAHEARRPTARGEEGKGKMMMMMMMMID
ncbi:hypothetical protein DFJ73DRAFT_837691 [Zopfochytrium polystomum]|nr:hypothetical protein DFJ73DRAFT_837691 [Zopfochytrium polystomum]